MGFGRSGKKALRGEIDSYFSVLFFMGFMKRQDTKLYLNFSQNFILHESLYPFDHSILSNKVAKKISGSWKKNNI